MEKAQDICGASILQNEVMSVRRWCSMRNHPISQLDTNAFKLWLLVKETLKAQPQLGCSLALQWQQSQNFGANHASIRLHGCNQQQPAVCTDFSGVFHCLDAKTGKVHWTYDLLAACWSSPMIVNDRIYISDEDGDVAVFKLSSQMELLQETNLGSAIYTTPIVANDTLFMTTSNRLWALQEGAKSEPVGAK